MVVFWSHFDETCILLNTNSTLLKEINNQLLKIFNVPHGELVSHYVLKEPGKNDKEIYCVIVNYVSLRRHHKNMA